MSAQAPTVLQRILESTRADIERRKRAVSAGSLRRELAGRGPAGQRDTGSFRAALESPGVGVIAEFKRRSPSAGPLREGADAAQIARTYARAGACALSVLTEGPHFDGSLDDLRATRAASDLPILRKDFVVDAYQLYEACVAGADAVLLIVAALDDSELAVLFTLARDLGLDVLVEVHDSAEVQTALGLEGAILGINNRDLRDFSVDVERTARLMQEIPAGVRVVSESGIGGHGQLADLAAMGVAAVLVGESLMRAQDPGVALRELLGQDAPEPGG